MCFISLMRLLGGASGYLYIGEITVQNPLIDGEGDVWVGNETSGCLWRWRTRAAINRSAMAVIIQWPWNGIGRV